MIANRNTIVVLWSIALLMSSFHKFCYVLVLRVFSYLKPLLIIFCLFIRIKSTSELAATTQAVNKLVARLIIRKVKMTLKIEKVIMTLVKEKTCQSKS